MNDGWTTTLKGWDLWPHFGGSNLDLEGMSSKHGVECKWNRRHVESDSTE